MKKFMKKSNKGFSMIELIIVIAIMAILIAVLAPVYTKYLEKARKSDDVTLADHLKTAIETTLIDPDITNPTLPVAATDLNGHAAFTGTELTFWNSVAEILKFDDSAAMTNATTGILSKCKSTGKAKVVITISDTSVVTVQIQKTDGTVLAEAK